MGCSPQRTQAFVLIEPALDPTGTIEAPTGTAGDGSGGRVHQSFDRGTLMNSAARIPDLILHNGRFTPLDGADPTAIAVAIESGRLIAVGRDEDILAVVDPLAPPSPECVVACGIKAEVIVVDDVSDSWAWLSDSLLYTGVRVTVSDRAPEFLLLGRPDTPICLIIDVRPGRDGLQFQQRLAAANIVVPIIFVTGFGNVVTSVRAMKNGAVDFLSKPVRDEDLLEAVERALVRDRAWCDEQRALSVLKSRFETLSLRERQVMAQVVEGRRNKQIAGDLGISEITVKAHRGQAMRKMKAGSLPELARMADKIAQANSTPYGDMKRATA
jgi:FixJ family two-component response regulator